MTPRTSSRRRARSGSSASASTRARASCTSIVALRGPGAAVPGPRGAICRRDAARARSAGPEPDPERERSCRCRDAGRCRGGGGAERPGRDATQSAILPLVPYLDALRWVFIAVALGGIAVTIYARLDDWKSERRWPRWPSPARWCAPSSPRSADYERHRYTRDHELDPN
jgi:hypothetical protein